MPSTRHSEHSTSTRPRTRPRRDSKVSKPSHRDRPREHHRERDRGKRDESEDRDHHRDRDHDRGHDHSPRNSSNTTSTHRRDRDRDRDHDHDRDHHSRSSKSTSSHRHRSPSSAKTSTTLKGLDILDPKLKQAMTSALTAGAVEAIRVRNKSGHWVGAKGVKVATAALGAAVVQNTVNKNPDEDGGKKVAGGTVGGLVMGQLIDKLK